MIKKSLLTVVTLLIGIMTGAGLAGFGFQTDHFAKAETAPVSTGLQKANDLKIVQTHNVMIVPSHDGRLLFGYGNVGGGWDKYELQEGTKGTAVVHNGVAGLAIEGENISEIAAFSHQSGKWHSHRLVIPASKRVVPIVSNDIVLYWVEGHAYAFSGRKGAWDVVPCKVPPALQSGSATVIDDQRIAVFSTDIARWDVLKMDDIQPPAAP